MVNVLFNLKITLESLIVETHVQRTALELDSTFLVPSLLLDCIATPERNR